MWEAVRVVCGMELKLVSLVSAITPYSGAYISNQVQAVGQGGCHGDEEAQTEGECDSALNRAGL